MAGRKTVAGKRTSPTRVNLHDEARREKFCRLYVQYMGMGVDAAGRRAAIEAGYSAKRTGLVGDLTAQPAVQQRIRALLEEGFARDQMTPQEIVARLARLARRDPRALFTEDGDHVLPQDLAPDIAFAIVGLDTELKFDADGAPPTAVRKYRLVNPLPALRTLAEVHGMLDPNSAASGTGIGDRLARARARLREQARDAQAIEVTPTKERAA